MFLIIIQVSIRVLVSGTEISYLSLVLVILFIGQNVNPCRPSDVWHNFQQAIFVQANTP